MRNVLTLPFDEAGNLIVASDNSGAIGMKKDDLVFVPYETVAYYSFRVAVMECMAAGGDPISVILHNFCGNEAWEKLTSGIQRGVGELQLKNVPITGSTESNFTMHQSAIGIIVLGKKQIGKMEEIIFNEQSKIAIIGNPLVGNEVIEQEDQIAPLPIFQKISRLEGIGVWPVGSKGIQFELNQMVKNKTFLKEQIITDIDIVKSSGPATCFLVTYQENREEEIKKLAGSYFHSVQIKI
ncbi:ATP-binding protein [Neobacillus cucumis]|uniref:ATP-binding protein n=1 Tax=Neobacillus cucumis TaxID=1740721 RepID=UPI00285338E1|nr:ATP-binding protein [Neobacillus cucumis]MDR4947775.1 ATP-binding protein [Neobacillus cucumis]